ncbi:hypothetical protein [Massilia sp. Leaf139]|uniref:hypothetical protein n=1 Tax=Massilia sp. Leaf139 TaxID=1736272 RepID=UPI000701E8D0|nr:hypothetical protein [Massilia sp. Leaf139]KQQ96161.1 hypothetical protein ASF77_21905 [Massilia sp. Leaf139]
MVASSPVSSVSQLVTVIRSELSKVATPLQRAAGALAESQPRGARYAQSRLPGLIAARIRQIGRDDPQRGRKAFRVFLEAVLLSSFGEQMVADPRFHQLVDDVQQAMESQPACAQLVGEAIDQLLARHS